MALDCGGNKLNALNKEQASLESLHGLSGTASQFAIANAICWDGPDVGRTRRYHVIHVRIQAR